MNDMMLYRCARILYTKHQIQNTLEKDAFMTFYEIAEFVHEDT
jgi:hypothetical protein